MRRLPQLTFDSQIWQLPLSEHAAEVLAGSFLLDDPDTRRQRLTELLSEEANLALWVICRAPPWRRTPPSSVHVLAAWLAEYGVMALQWPAPEPPLTPPPERALVALWSDLAATAVATARSAAGLADGPHRVLVYLGGLLHAAVAWLSSCGPPISLTEDPASGGCLPPWLAVWLQAWQACPADELAARIADGLQAPDALPLPAPKTNAENLHPADRRDGAEVQQICRRWQPSRVTVSPWLPALMRSLARLQKLEGDFERELQQAKLEALKTLAYGASHEINNPLANISTRAQTLMREETDPERRRKLAVINAQAFRAHEMISDLMLFARPPAMQPQPVDLDDLADQVIRELLPEASAQGTALTRQPSAERLTISADPTYLAVALKALCTNSLEAIGSGGSIEIAIHPAADPPLETTPRDWVQIVVRDTGPGIRPEFHRHLFDPYFSGREAGRGLGLGLSKCWRIVDQHGGQVRVDSQLGHGTTFTLLLPHIQS